MQCGEIINVYVVSTKFFVAVEKFICALLLKYIKCRICLLQHETRLWYMVNWMVAQL
jgi:hypothetical protein